MEGVTCLLEHLGFKDLIAFVKRHHVLWLCNFEALYASPRIPETLKGRFQELRTRLAGEKDAALHALFKTPHTPTFRAPAKVRALESYLAGHGPLQWLPEAASPSTWAAVQRTRPDAPFRVPCPERPTLAQRTTAKAFAMSTLAWLFDTSPCARTTLDWLLEDLGGLTPLKLSLNVADECDQAFSQAQAIGFPLGAGLRWNGESLCPLFECAWERLNVPYQVVEAGSLVRRATNWRAPWVSGPWLVLPLPDALPDHLLIALANLVVGVHLDTLPLSDGPDYADDDLQRVAFLRCKLQLDTRLPPPPTPVAQGRALIQDGGRALLAGSPIPPTLPHAATLAIWLGPGGDRAGAAEGFGFEARGKLLFFVGNGIMTPETLPLWRSKAERHVKCSRDLVAILDKCVERRKAACTW